MASAGVILRAARGRLGLSQGEVADRAGIYQNALSLMETGRIKRPKAETVAKLCNVLEVPFDELDGAFEKNGSASRERPEPRST